MTYYLYRVQIIEQPEWEERLCFVRRDEYDTGDTYLEKGYHHCPVGWKPDDDYIAHFDTDRWIEPALDKAWRSRSSAAARRDILNAAGYTAIVQRSAPVVWPADGHEKINDSEVTQVTHAIRVLKRAGLITSADDLIK